MRGWSLELSELLVLLHHPHLLGRSQNACLHYVVDDDQRERWICVEWMMLCKPRVRWSPELQLSRRQSHRQWRATTSSGRSLAGGAWRGAWRACGSGTRPAWLTLPWTWTDQTDMPEAALVPTHGKREMTLTDRHWGARTQGRSSWRRSKPLAAASPFLYQAQWVDQHLIFSFSLLGFLLLYSAISIY
jgi:hypothetical protein